MGIVGHSSLRNGYILSQIRSLTLPSAQLRVADLRGMWVLRVIDLQGNALTRVEGLEALPHLLWLNLSANALLNLPYTLNQLSANTKLEQVALGTDLPYHAIWAENPKYRQQVLNASFPGNPFLTHVDTKAVTPEEHVAVLKRTDKKAAEEFRFRVAVLRVCGIYEWHPLRVKDLWDPSAVSLRLPHWKLTVCDFSDFFQLQELDLSHNRLTSLTGMGLETLPKLRVLDVTYNDLRTPLQEIVQLLDQMTVLQCLAIRHNPIMKSKKDRLKLIGDMESMRKIACRLSIIDTRITLDERIEVWRAQGGSIEEVQRLRLTSGGKVEIGNGTATRSARRLAHTAGVRFD